jgi:hypothetical protein
MHAKLVTFGLFAATLIATGCASQSADDSEGGAAGALSAEDCAPKADAEQAKALKSCQAANVFDLAACKKPVDEAFVKWQTDLNAAYQAVHDKIDPITGSCKNLVDEKSCKDLLSEAGKDFAAAAGDQKACDALRTTRKAKCDRDAESAIQDALGADNTYTALVDQQASVEASYLGGTVSCQVQSAAISVSAATCPAQAAVTRQSAYLSCRHECPKVADAPCTPADYKGQDVQCGKLTTVSSGLGLFCESGTQCGRTSLCDKYDSAKSDVDRLNKSSGCTTAAGTPGVMIAKLTGAPNAAPTGVTTLCQELPAPATK